MNRLGLWHGYGGTVRTASDDHATRKLQSITEFTSGDAEIQFSAEWAAEEIRGFGGIAFHDVKMSVFIKLSLRIGCEQNTR